MIVKKQLLAAASLLLLFTSCQKDLTVSEEQSVTGETVSSDVTIETTPPVWTSVRMNVNSNVAGFWQGVPAKYSQNPSKYYPLILFIHGIGELGTSLTRMNCCGLPRHLRYGTFPANFNINGVNHSFIVIAPQFKVRPSAAQMQSVIDFAKRRWRIDASRIYVTGLSMGGGSTWDYAAVYGQNAAAIVPVCGGTKPTVTMAANIAKKNLPIWGIYSSSDQVVPVQWGRDFFSWIDARNPAYASKTKLTIWSGVTHNSTWGRAFNPLTKVDGYNIYQWMLFHKRGSVSSVPPAPTDPEPDTDPTTPPPPTTTTNKLPVARAGTDKTIYLSQGINRVTLDGSASTDPDGTISRAVWTKVSGPSCTMFNFGFGKTYAAHMLQGSYVFKLTVTDNKGAVATDLVNVYVKTTFSSTTPPPTSGTGTSVGNKAPVARAGADKTIYLSEGVNRVTLDGTSSYDPDGTITKIVWTKVSGPSASLVPFAFGKTWSAQMNTKGTYLFKVTVTDNKGAWAMDYVDVFVK
jgi:poly(3-hydroxybutyrate) depolymerase